MKRSQYQEAIIEAHLGRGSFMVSAKPGSSKSTTAGWCAQARPTENHHFIMFSDTLYKDMNIRLAGVTNATVAKIFQTGNQVLKRKMAGVRFGDVDRFKYIDFFKEHPIVKKASGATLKKGQNNFAEKSAMSMAWSLDSGYRLVTADLACEVEPHIAQESWEQFGWEPPTKLQPEEAAQIFRDAAAFGRRQLYKGSLAFIDMIYYPIHDMDLGYEFPQEDIVLVDEWQDLSRLQREIVRALNPKELKAFGDRRQSIFEFAGAAPDSMDYALALCNGNELPLSICYRCPPDVVELAQGIVNDIEPWEDHPMSGRECVHRIECEQIHEHLREGDVVLSRTKAPMIALCFDLIRKGFPATIKGDDVAGKIKQDMWAVKRHMHSQINFESSFLDAIDRYKAEQRRLIQSRMFGHAKAMKMLADRVECLRVLCVKNQPHSFDELMRQLDTIFNDANAKIVLMTAHKAKGLEWDSNVFLLNYDQMPLVWRGQTIDQFQQELNLKYVAITRAKRNLFLVSSPLGQEEDED